MKLLLAIKLPVTSFGREQHSDCEDHTSDATLAFPVRNYVSGDLGNYVSDIRLNLGNYVSADIQGAFLTNEHVHTLSYDGPDGVLTSSLTSSGYDLSMFRLRPSP